MGFLDRLRGRPEPERSAGGSRIYRHKHVRKPTISGGDAALIEAISDHIEAHIGEPTGVYHQIVSPYVHVDIHMVPPTDGRPWTTLVTSGMSERPMSAPPELGTEFSRAELTMALPPDWPVDDESFSDERNYWPFRLLQTLAALPHQFDTWLWFDHTIPNGDPPEPYAENTALCCAMLGPPALPGPDFALMRTNDHVVAFLAVYPLHADEMRFKLEVGADELAERLEAAGVTELLDPARPSVLAT